MGVREPGRFMIPSWLHILSVLSLVVGFISAAIIALDVWRRPQHMWIMNVVWPVTALFAGLLALIGYYAYGRAPAHSAAHGASAAAGMAMSPRDEPPFWVMVAKGTTHCGAGCTIGDILAEWLVYFVPSVALWFGWQSIFSDRIFAVWVLAYILAFAFGIAFQYFTIKPMRSLSVGMGIVAAAKADALSLTAWQVGVYGFMALAHFVIFAGVFGARLEVASPEFWFMMQIAMICGFVTAYPVNWWLIRAGIKERM